MELCSVPLLSTRRARVRETITIKEIAYLCGFQRPLNCRLLATGQIPCPIMSL